MYLLITEHFDPWVGRIPWRRKWKPTPVFLPGKFHGQRSLVGYSPWDHRESDTTKHVHTENTQKETRNEKKQNAHSLKTLYPKEVVQFSCSVVSDSLQPHELQHARPSCPSPTPRAYPNSCPLSQRRHSTISSSAVPFSSCPQSF